MYNLKIKRITDKKEQFYFVKKPIFKKEWRSNIYIIQGF